jgi:hypothetical protein
MNAGEAREAEFVGTVRAVPHTRFLHLTLRFLRPSSALGSPLFWPHVVVY